MAPPLSAHSTALAPGSVTDIVSLLELFSQQSPTRDPAPTPVPWGQLSSPDSPVDDLSAPTASSSQQSATERLIPGFFEDSQGLDSPDVVEVPLGQHCPNSPIGRVDANPPQTHNIPPAPTRPVAGGRRTAFVPPDVVVGSGISLRDLAELRSPSLPGLSSGASAPAPPKGTKLRLHRQLHPRQIRPPGFLPWCRRPLRRWPSAHP